MVIGHTAWDGLLFRDLDTGEFKPLLATGYKWVDNVTLEFDLRDDVVFHDGSSFDADDVVYTVNHVSNKDNGVLTFKNVNWMKNAEKLGSHKVKHQPARAFPGGPRLSFRRGLHHAQTDITIAHRRRPTARRTTGPGQPNGHRSLHDHRHGCSVNASS